MPNRRLRLLGCLIASGALLLIASPATRAEPAELESQPGLIERASNGAQQMAASALSLLGINYRFGGNSPDTGFDCSGLVRHVVRNALGLDLPRTAREMARLGERIPLTDLKPGDLVFFNTMRRTFSHVGIYLGDNRFVHAPSSGGEVRVEDMSERYWVARFQGARRLPADTQ